MAESRFLLRNGYVIDTDPAPVVRPGTDVLIEGDRIIEVGPGLSADGATVIDATDRIVLPGFVDTHRHLWQTAVRAGAADLDLGAYMGLVLGQYGPRFRPQDIHAATLVGALDALDAGITTLIDYSHALHTPEHADAAIDALHTSGLRTVFGYGFPFHGDQHPADIRRIRSERLSDDQALVTMSLAPAGPSFSPIETVTADWHLADDLGLPLTIHVSSGPVAARPITALRENGLLRGNTLYVHGNSLDDDELKLIAESGGTASVTPATEAQMRVGAPVAGRLRSAGVTVGLGVDAVSSLPGDMFSVMRAALLASQIADNPPLTVGDVLKMATLDGAAALGLADRTGSLRPGKQADVILLRLNDLNMLTTERDPIAAVVTAANPDNVDTVLVAGQVVKANGKLLHGDLTQAVRSLRATAATVNDH
ncbi:amidohydrolase family protein [Streptomyces sp. DSM 40750]|uniref:amidohydrolase family protein n=1 Tax=Streptomyces sp. DSM 40750 TaxID=2801030 RepID=UPI00214D0A89|nr:amidohydrolase family protein [Streptomyces sp. DSM 40750]UUU19629.1 amidohydrolase family protein [Streptomyces sp. DSM 40750]UUU27029.1 amidohydrolase family protein [Streptomyces sp. DSM 40750]